MDYLLDTNGKMLLKNGDFVIGESEQQEIDLLLMSSPGDWKENPAVGVNLPQLVKSRSTETAIKKSIHEQLTADGFKKITIKINYPNIEVDAIR